MERWLNRVAVVTGASSGIGAACVRYLVENGMNVVGLARRQARVEALRDALKPAQRNRLHAIKCDVSNEAEVVSTFRQIERQHGPVAVLVNNAGIVRFSELVSADNSEDLRAIIDTNVLGVAWCTREAFQSMKAHGGGDGHVIMINSIMGHQVGYVANRSFSIYAPSKHAVTAMTEVYRQEFQSNNTKVKVTSISPGAVDTEVMSGFDESLKTDFPMLEATDVAEAVIYCLQTPPHLQIHELTIKPIGEKF